MEAEGLRRESIRLRAGRVEDLDALYALDQLCYPPGIAYSMPEMRYYLARPGAIAMVAEEDDGKVTGFAIAHLVRYGKVQGGHVITIDVAREARRSGVGTRLMRAVEGRLRSAGVSLIRLEVAVDNPGAQAFYEGLGFKATSRLRGYYLEKLDARLMEKKVAGADASAPEGYDFP